jgi:hypothetical protein
MNQLQLFPVKLYEIPELIGVNWISIQELSDNELLSFDIKVDRELGDRELREVTFLGKLIIAGCDIRMIKILTRNLTKPYDISLDSELYDWGNNTWIYKGSSEAVESLDEDMICEYISNLKEENDQDALDRIKDALD